MPILLQEPCIYPPALLDQSEMVEEDPGWSVERRWWVIYTKSRQEKAIARELYASEIPFYLPLIKKTNYYRGRKLSSYSPLFSGYVFLFATEEERGASLLTNRVSRILPVPEPARLRHDLSQIRQLIAANVPLTIESRLERGDRVRVRSGPLAGLEGTVLVRRGGTRLLVTIDFLQQGASVEIDDFCLEPLGAPLNSTRTT